MKHENFSKMKILKVDRWALSLITYPNPDDGFANLFQFKCPSGVGIWGFNWIWNIVYDKYSSVFPML